MRAQLRSDFGGRHARVGGGLLVRLDRWKCDPKSPWRTDRPPSGGVETAAGTWNAVRFVPGSDRGPLILHVDGSDDFIDGVGARLEERP